MSQRRQLAAHILVFLLVLCASFTVTLAQDQTTHTVQRGETLYRIALRYGVSMDSIIQANNITNASRIFAGQQLIIPNYNPAPAEVENPLVAGTPIKHTVTYGDTLGSIAAKYGMTVEQLIEINNISNPNRILRGQELTVWSTTPVDTAVETTTAEVAVAQPIPAEAPQPITESTTYVVQAGEGLAQIANRFGVSWVDIANANGIANANQIYAGQTLTIPGVVADAGAGGGSAQTVSAFSQFAPAPPTIFVGKQVVVDLSDQMLYAYQDGVLVRSVRVSTGLPNTPTVQGDYKVYWMLNAQTMSGPGYYLPDVPYVMYFYQGYEIGRASCRERV